MLIGLDGDALDVDTSCRGVFVIERLLGLQITARLLGHDPRERVPSLVDVDLLNSDLVSVGLQVLSKGSRRERRTRLTCPVMSGPQWSL